MKTPTVTVPPEFLENATPDEIDLQAGIIEVHAGLLRLEANRKRVIQATEEFLQGVSDIVGRRTAPAPAAPAVQG